MLVDNENVVQVDSKQFPLTRKWQAYIRGFSYREKLPFQECLQEAYIIEWELAAKEKIDTLEYQENYFKLVLKRRLETLMLKSYHGKVRISVHGTENIPDRSTVTAEFDASCNAAHPQMPIWNKLVFTATEVRDFQSTVLGLDEPSGDVFDSLVVTRPFNEVHFEELTTHVAYLLYNINQMVFELFLRKLILQKTWKELKSQYYSEMPHNQFYNRVKTIKDVVQKEICYN